jgi:peptidoglycan/LPS O-acetylase OafA/YrhL
MLTKTHTNIGKGIAILLVILGHILLEIYHVHTFIQSIGVFLFLILSGYGITASVISKGSYKNIMSWFFRMEKVLVPYWLVTLCKIIILALFGSVTFSIAVILKGFFFDLDKTIDSTMWFVLYIIVWYIVSALIFFFIRNKWLMTLLFFIVAGLFIMFVDLSNWAFYALGFPIGVLWRNYERTWSGLYDKLPASLYFILFILLAIANTSVIKSFSLGMPTTLLAAIFVLCFVNKFFQQQAWLEWIGKISFELYLIEGFWLYTTKSLYVGHSSFLNLLLYLGLLLVSYLLYLGGERLLQYGPILLKKSR